MSIMKLLFKILGTDKIYHSKESQLRFGITLLCLSAASLYLLFAAFYLVVGITVLRNYTFSQAVLGFALYLYCRSGKPLSYKLAYVLLCISVMTLHILLTYSFGDVGTTFIAVAAIMPNHLFNILRKKAKPIFDAFLLLCVNVGFWVAQNTTPQITLGNIEAFRFGIMNLCLLVCFFELYLNLLSQMAAERINQETIKKTSQEALKDALTGLGNRRLYTNEIKKQVLSAEEGSRLVVAVMDIDYFKKVNDSYGHHVGDAVLIFIADSMKQMFRKSDVLIRWGGEEFLLLFWGAGVAEIKSIMSQYLQFLHTNPVQAEGLELSVTVTVGIKKHVFGTSLDETVTNADKLMYSGKTQGRDRVITDPEDELDIPLHPSDTNSKDEVVPLEKAVDPPLAVHKQQNLG